MRYLRCVHYTLNFLVSRIGALTLDLPQLQAGTRYSEQNWMAASISPCKKVVLFMFGNATYVHVEHTQEDVTNFFVHLKNCHLPVSREIFGHNRLRS